MAIRDMEAVPGPDAKPRNRTTKNNNIGSFTKPAAAIPMPLTIIARTTIGLRPMRSARYPQNGELIENDIPCAAPINPAHLAASAGSGTPISCK